MPRVTYRLDLAYDGTDFAGFQQQAGLKTVEGTILDGLRAFLPDLPRVAVGGRTDKGVHANGQVVSFWTWRSLSLADVAHHVERAGEGSIAVLDARVVDRSFHASFSGTGRRYRYRFRCRPDELAPLDAMFCALVGRRCFYAFSRRTPPTQTTVRHLRTARVFADGPGWGRVEFEADGFLRHQVRVMVSTALTEMRNGAPSDVLSRLSSLGDRAATAPPAEASGLYLMGVDYV